MENGSVGSQDGSMGKNGSVSHSVGNGVGKDGSVSNGVGEGSVDNGGVDNRGVGNNVGGSVSNHGSGSVVGLARVGDLGNVTALSVGVVGHGLGPAVGQGHGVLTAGGVAVTVLVLGKFGAGVVVGHAVLVGVDGGLVGVDLRGVGRGVGGGVLGHGGGGQEGKGKGDLEFVLVRIFYHTV